MANKIIQLKDGNDNVYPIGIVQGGGGTSTIDYDVVSTTDDSVVLADYVVECGAAQITPPTGFNATHWFYRKWNSGKAECWHYSTINTAITSPHGSLYYVRINNYPYPSGLFLNAPVLLNNVERAVGLCFIKISANTKDDVSFCICDSNADTALDTIVHFHAIGTWK